MKEPLTQRQLEIYAAIRYHVITQGVPPTIREMMTALQIKSTNGVRAVIQVLIKKGWLTYPTKGAVRGIRLIDDEWKHDSESLRLVETVLAWYINADIPDITSRERDVAHDVGVSIRQELVYATKAQTALADRKMATKPYTHKEV